jgi:hypothetical protein
MQLHGAIWAGCRVVIWFISGSVGAYVLSAAPVFCLHHCLFRCPNPEACEHNLEKLTAMHPCNQSTPGCAGNSTWVAYERQLCKPGYTGAACNVCDRSYGQTDISPVRSALMMATSVVQSLGSGRHTF